MKFKTVQFIFIFGVAFEFSALRSRVIRIISILFLVMAQYPELHLVPNHCGIWSNSVPKRNRYDFHDKSFVQLIYLQDKLNAVPRRNRAS
ncbi:hypothetical protein T01_11072 [Trichinella spiralis]|uniref:Uncharacterized protein n=1 Tax=Trichinella spiralis TaxID=6334 RepID=A0A0V1C1E4_TRISP|nr:hypothetical protein T01_11072 [Trichinella spiralis]